MDSKLKALYEMGSIYEKQAIEEMQKDTKIKSVFSRVKGIFDEGNYSPAVYRGLLELLMRINGFS